MKKPKTKNYVNNADLFKAVVEYLEKCDQADLEQKQIPIVPNYVGVCIKTISERIASRSNFSGYPFREEMIMDGIENCLRYIRKYNREMENPFAYFSMIIWNAFLHRIAKEKKQMYIRFKSSQDMMHTLGTMNITDGDEHGVNLTMNADYINDFIEEYELKMNKNKAPKE